MIGKTLGKYKIVERLGRGGMAEVYKAYQANLDRHVALKLIRTSIADNPESLTRFDREAKSAAALRHPNIVQIYDFDVDAESGQPYMVMELIEGGSLADELEKRAASGTPLTLADIARIMGQVGAALAYAHQHGVIHRDIKPANVMQDTSGRMILTDFGLAKVIAGPSITSTGVSVGTPDYMAPEQVMGEPADARADLYALGVILFKLLTGQLPYRAETPTAVMLKRVTDPVPDPRTIKPDLPESLARVAMKSMSKSPDERFQTADEFLAEFHAALAETERAFQPMPQDRPAAAHASGKIDEATWDMGAIRQLLMAAFEDDELTALCFDHFRPVYEKLGKGAGKSAKIQELLEYCEHHVQLNTLLKLVKECNPAQYAHFASRFGQQPAAGKWPGRGTAPSPYVVTLEITPPPEPNIPPRVVDFIGREAELAFFADKLTRQHLAVIFGMPGVGKTALASELARRQNRSACTFWHSFHEGEGVGALLWKLAGFLAWHGQRELWNTLQGSTQTGSQAPPPEVLMDYLFQMVRGQGYLLCFDDFQFVDDDPLLEQFIERLQPALEAGKVDVIIATQRRPAFVPEGEWPPLRGLALADMRSLLAQRGLELPAQAAADLHAYTDGNAELVMMAIDALRRTQDPTRLIHRLAESEQVERFLVKQVDEGLTDEERSVMSAVAVLLGQAGTRDAIAAVLDGASVRRPLNDLVSRSLLTVIEGEGGKEYTMNEMVRAYYYDLLSQRERQAMHRRAGEFYEHESPDALRAALHLQRCGEHARALQLVTADVWVIINQGQARILRQSLEAFAERQLAQGSDWVKALLARGQVYELLGETDKAQASYETALAQAQALPDAAGSHELQARACLGLGELLQEEAPQSALTWLRRGLEALNGLHSLEEAALHIRTGRLLVYLSDLDAALTALQQGLDRLPPGPSRLRIAALGNLGNIHCIRGEIERGLGYYHQVLETAHAMHDYWAMVEVWINLGFELDTAGRWAEALAQNQQALEQAERLGSPRQQARALAGLGYTYLKQGETELAKESLSKCMSIVRSRGWKAYIIYAGNSLAAVHLALSELEEAERWLTEVEQLAQALGVREQLPETYRDWALVRLAQDRPAEALAYAGQSVSLAREIQSYSDEGIGLRVLGQAQWANGQREVALVSFESSLKILGDRDPYEVARAKLEWGKCLNVGGEAERGAALLQEARSAFLHLDAKRALADVERQLN